VALASAVLFCLATNPAPEDGDWGVGTLLRPNMSRSTPPTQKRSARMFGVQRSSVKLIDRTLHGMVVRPMEHDTQKKSSQIHFAIKPPLGRAA
jgi:hypothetical protein